MKWYKTEPKIQRQYAETFDDYLRVLQDWMRVSWMIGTGRWRWE